MVNCEYDIQWKSPFYGVLIVTLSAGSSSRFKIKSHSYGTESLSIHGALSTAFLDDAVSGADVVHVAVCRACNVATADSDFRLYPLPPFRSDEELDALRFDIPGLAAAAVDVPEADRGRVLWEWWLTEAVPAAWRAFPDDATPGAAPAAPSAGAH
jgi:hypothetical protein